ncbi:hypothetical protein ACVIN2_002466 [Bradyrhizobium sp. USDA 3650]
MASKTWSSGNNWNTAGNWSPSGVPVAGDDVILNRSGNQTLTLDVASSVALKSLTISNSLNTLAIGANTLNVTAGGGNWHLCWNW